MNRREGNMKYDPSKKYAFVCSCGRVYESKYIDRYTVENDKATKCHSCGQLAGVQFRPPIGGK